MLLRKWLNEVRYSSWSKSTRSHQTSFSTDVRNNSWQETGKTFSVCEWRSAHAHSHRVQSSELIVSHVKHNVISPHNEGRWTHRQEVVCEVDVSLCGVVVLIQNIGEEIQTVTAFLIKFCWLNMFREEAQTAALSFKFVFFHIWKTD